ncbi:MAG: ABC transporter permease [Deltaproteobacteria bacterium]|jgi:phospholipid/cholesterol/gamma-HCH transport system permease protein
MNFLRKLLRALVELLGQAGGRFSRQIARLLGVCALFYRLLLGAFTGPACLGLFFRELCRQVYYTAIRGSYILIFTSLMLGMLVIVHATQQLVKVQGEEFIGWLLVTIVVREVGPVWAAFFVLLHSGSAITVEIGTMNVNREIRALEMMGIDPYRYLGVPRFWGLTLSLLSLYILSVFAAIIGGYLFAQAFAEIFWAKFWLSFLNALQWIDLSLGFAKTTIFGMLIATVSIYFGFDAEDDMGEVAHNTSQTAIWSLVLIGIVDILLTAAYYL